MTAHMEYALEYWKTIKPEGLLQTNQSHIEEIAAQTLRKGNGWGLKSTGLRCGITSCLCAIGWNTHTKSASISPYI